MRSAICCASPDRTGSRPGAGATTSRQTPSCWVDSTTGYAAAWPLGDRATRAESSRRNSTSSSARMRTPVRAATSKGAAVSSTDRTTHTPLPS